MNSPSFHFLFYINIRTFQKITLFFKFDDDFEYEEIYERNAQIQSSVLEIGASNDQRR